MLAVTKTANTQGSERCDLHFFPLFSPHYLYTLQEFGFTLHTFIVTNICAYNYAVIDSQHCLIDIFL